MGLFGKNDKNIVILKKTRPGECGGTDATLDKSAPKVIKSDVMTLFEVDSSCTTVSGTHDAQKYIKPIASLYAFAAPAGDSTLLYKVVSEYPRRRNEQVEALAFVKGDVMPRLAELVRELNLAEKNGFHSTTHGLPEDFGGSVNIEYEGGEKISFSNNQSPIMKVSDMVRIDEVFDELLEGEKEDIPSVSDISKIAYEQKRDGGGFTRATLTLKPDGTGTCVKEARYEDPKVYRSEKETDRETVAKIKKIANDSLMLGWNKLPDEVYPFSGEETISFTMSDANVITVKKVRALPEGVDRAFFNIYLEINK